MLQLDLSRVHSSQHSRDIKTLTEAGIAVPDCYVHPDVRDSWWCRVREGSALVSGFVVERSRSRLLPGTSLLRVSRFGRAIHAPLIPSLSAILPDVASRFAFVQRLDISVFEEDDSRRRLLESGLVDAGMLRVPARTYTRTLRLDLTGDDEAVFARLSASTRRNIREAEKCGLRTVPLSGEHLLPAMTRLYKATFLRTGVDAPVLDFRNVFASATDRTSALFGVFVNGAEYEPEALVAFAWVRSNGDHAVYDVAASTRRPELGRTPLGYPLLWTCARWARASGLQWMDLGGVPGVTVPTNSPLHSIAAFKRGFSTFELDVGAQYRFEPNQVLSALARGVRRFAAALHPTIPS
jgi:hypothetical protein